MNTFTLILKLSAPAFVAVGMLHLFYGLQADAMLGAVISEATLQDPVLDSQNRFYGISFTLYGVLLFLSAMDLKRYGTVLRCILFVFFAAGLSRFVSIFTHGMPSNLVLLLLASELTLPPILWIWLSRIEVEN